MIFMIGQCLSNKNESATVPKTKKFSELNKAFLSFIYISKNPKWHRMRPLIYNNVFAQ